MATASPMTGDLDMVAMNAALKELYNDQDVQNLVYSDNPFLALVPKNTNFGGKYKPIPIIIGTSQGRSATFASALANQSPVQIQSFLLERKHDYSIASIDNETMLASKTDKYSFLEGAKVVVDGAIRSLTLSLASGLYRAGTGTIGIQSGATGATGIITLSDPNSIVQFEVNMALEISDTDGGAVTGGSATGYVISVNRSAGTFVISASMGGAAADVTGWANGKYIRVVGDANLKVSGLQAWIPATAPSATLFYNVNRSTDSVRLGGVRYDGSAYSIEEALIDASMLVAREGGKPDYCFMSFGSYGALEKALGSKVQYVDLAGPGRIAFRGIRINGHNSEIKVVADRNCPSNTAFLLQLDTWKLESLGEAPQILRYGDGLEMLRVSNQDAGEVRVGYYANLACNAPGWNANVTLGA